MGVGFEELHSTHVLVSGTRLSPNFPISVYAAHEGELVSWYGRGRPVITSRWVIGYCSYSVDGVSYSG